LSWAFPDILAEMEGVYKQSGRKLLAVKAGEVAFELSWAIFKLSGAPPTKSSKFGIEIVGGTVWCLVILMDSL
jgi:hypothetical protein